ncbi:MAG: hypothetical protein N2489_07205 [Clostridia bacterium]|nr:hypothetical protein [Clostridia bacterium]
MDLRRILLVKTAIAIGAFILLVLTLLLTSCSSLEGNLAGKNNIKAVINDTIVTEKATKGDLSVSLQGAGYLVPARAVNLYYNDLSGPLKKVHAMLGDEVKLGQAIFEIDVKEVLEEIKRKELEIKLLELKIQQLDQSIAINKAAVGQAERDLELSKKSHSVEPTLISQNALDKVRTQLERARCELKNSFTNKEMGIIQLELSKSELDKLQEKLKQGTLVSPIDGKIVYLERVYESERINSGRVLARIAEKSDIVFQMVTAEARNIQGNIEAVINLGGEKHPVMLYTPRPGDQLELVEKDQKIKNRVYFSFKNSMPNIDINVPVQVNVEVNKKGVLLLPKSAVRMEGGRSVTDIVKNGTAETVEIITGLADDSRVEVLGGINEETEILIK